METAAPQHHAPGTTSGERWHEIADRLGQPRGLYAKLLSDLTALGAGELRALDDRMQATLREMGVTFDIIRNDPWGQQPWICDLLPHVFTGEEWELVVRGVQQRLKAFECFLADVYGKKEILREGVVPIHAVLGSPLYQNASIGLPLPRGSYLHLSGICLARGPAGALKVKHHHFSHATGISYMMQNRRALARVIPELFQDTPVQSLAEMPLVIMERLREAAASFSDKPSVVLLSPGAGSAVSSEQSFLARRMGISMVQGGDLLVLDDRLYLKTVRGLERVEVIYNRVADPWLDPLVFRKDSMLGVPGLVHCLRKGSVALVNAVGSQLADDRSLLAFAPQIVRYYLGEAPVLPTVPTYWLGDIDQRELVLENLDAYRIRPIFREQVSGYWETSPPPDAEALRAAIRKEASRYVAQPQDEGATTYCFEQGKRVEHQQDHIVFAVRDGERFDVFPGALTRVFSRRDPAGDFGFGWTSKDSWVVSDSASTSAHPLLSRRASETRIPPRQVTSRVAESFYWMGRYLERAYHQAYLITVVETLEAEELNTAERKHYRPVWNRLLPPLEKSAGTSRRSIANPIDRYRLVLLGEPGSVASTFARAMANAESVQDSLSPEAWATLNDLRSRFQRTRFRDDLAENEAGPVTRRLSEMVTQLVPQFFAVAANTMLADDGWRFCEIGQMLERSILTANSILSFAKSLAPPSDDKLSSLHAVEIELSAFLRLLASRDAYRRIYQMRAEPAAVLELLWQNPQVPRSVSCCLAKCGALLRASTTPDIREKRSAAAAIDELIHRLHRTDWHAYVRQPHDEDEVGVMSVDERTRQRPQQALEPLLFQLLNGTLEIHTLICDGFLNHQARIVEVTQPRLQGL